MRAMHLGNHKFWRPVGWPVLFICLLYFVYYPHYDDAVRAWAQSPPVWDETNTPIEWSTEGRGILEKASELGNHPVLIYEFVRNEIQYDPYPGSRFGAVGALERALANDVDQAFLLAALLRAAYRNLNRDEPRLWLVRGDIQLTGAQALGWLGINSGEALQTYLTTSGLNFELNGNLSTKDFTLTLKNHVWLRGDLEFGPYRGARFVEGDDGILADLDPSFVIQQSVGPIPLPMQLSGIDSEAFVTQIRNLTTLDADEISVKHIPESLMLNQANSAAAVFRRLIEDKGLSARDALTLRRPTVETIEALPDALPFALNTEPVTYRLGDPVESQALLDGARHHVQLQWIRTGNVLGSGEILADATLPASHLYAAVLDAGFVAAAPLSDLELQEPELPNQTYDLQAEIRLDGENLSTITPAPTIRMGEDSRLQFAYQARDFPAAAPPAPMEDGASEKFSRETPAGSLFSLAFVPSLNGATSQHYYARTLSLASSLTGGVPIHQGGMSASEALAPSLDLMAQIVLGEMSDFIDLSARATGHRVSLADEWVMAGLEPAIGPGTGAVQLPRFVFASNAGKVPLGRVIDVADERYVPSSALQDLIQMAREALLVQGPSLALPRSVVPVSPGRLIRDANAESLLVYGLDSLHLNLLNEDVDRTPAGENQLRTNLISRAESGDFLLMPSNQSLNDPGGEDPTTLGLGWGYLSRSSRGDWDHEIWEPQAGLTKTFAHQDADGDLVTPGALVQGSFPAAYHDLAIRGLGGIESYNGARESTLHAFVAATHPLGRLLSESFSSASAGDRTFGAAATVVFLHAMLDEFSKPEVLDLRLELYANASDSTPTHQVKEGEVFNPNLHGKIVAVGAFNQVMDTYTFSAFDGGNQEIGTQSGIAGEGADILREVAWTLKDSAMDAFENLDDYNGPLELRLFGELFGRRSREAVSTYVIDTQPPTVALRGWPPDKHVRGDISVLGTATDLHFDHYTLEVAPGHTPQANQWSFLNVNGSIPVDGLGMLGRWEAGQLGLNGPYSVRLRAYDRVGNEAETIATLNVYNDNAPPTITFLPRPEGLHRGTVNFKINANDTGGSGIRNFKVSVTYQKRGYDDATGDRPIIWVGPEVIHEKNFPATTQPGQLDDDQSFPETGYYSIDTTNYQANAISPLIFSVEVRDDFNPPVKQSAVYWLSNTIFSSYLTRGVISPNDPFSQNVRETHLFVFGQPFTEDPVVEVYNTLPNGEIDTGSGPVRTLNKVVSGTIPPIGPIMTNFWAYRWTGRNQSGTVVPNGDYIVRLTLDDIVRDHPVLVVPANPPRLDITSPRYNILFKDAVNTPLDPQGNETSYPGFTPTVGRVAIVGWIDNDNFLQFEREDDEPLTRRQPPEFPYWILSYKPHSIPPLLAEVNDNVDDNQDGQEDTLFHQPWVSYEANWIEIAHGFSEKGEDGSPVLIADWDISKLPVGMYDLRLDVSDGIRNTLTGTIEGFQVMHSKVMPGDPTDGRDPGVLSLREVDFKVDFEGFPLEFARNYNSFRANTKGDFGWGWELEDNDIKIEILSEQLNSGDELAERIEANITLPDGRTFVYANRPPKAIHYGLGFAQSAWMSEAAFYDRPYGQMLWLPGRPSSPPYDSFWTLEEGTEPWLKIQGFKNSRSDIPDGQPNGKLGLLKLEDGSYLIFDWKTGKLLRRDYGDQKRMVDYVDDVYYINPELPPLPQTRITDHLSRQVRIVRDPGTNNVVEIFDPRGASFKYFYNELGELHRIVDRAGGERKLFYEKEGYPHYLTRMEILRGNGEKTVLNYDYDEDGLLKEIDAGDGKIKMAYQDLPHDGQGNPTGGAQVILDEATGGENLIEYDTVGRVTRQVDAAGIETTYSYIQDGPPDDTQIPGMLAEQTVAGVTTRFNYNVSAYNQPLQGTDGVLESFVKYLIFRESLDEGDPYPDEYVEGSLDPGFLTSLQVQPIKITTEMEIDGQPVDSAVELAYNEGSGRPDGSSKIYNIRDPEGRTVNIDYGTDATRNDTVGLTSPGDQTIDNDYVPSGDFKGRIQTSTRLDNGTPVETVNYLYDYKTSLNQYAELAQALAGLASQGVDVNAVWPNYAQAWIEKRTAETVVNGETTTQISYLDGLGNVIATKDENGDFTINLVDPEGRVVVSSLPSGELTQREYNKDGLIKKVTHTDAEDNTSETEYFYDDQGREVGVFEDGEFVSCTFYSVIAGQRHTIHGDRDGNKRTTITDAAGRVVREIFDGANGSKYETVYGYDEFGRRNYVKSPRGIITRSEFDSVGREIKTTVTADGVNLTSERRYDAAGRLLWEQDPLQRESGVYTTYRYNLTLPANSVSYGQLVAVFFEDDDTDESNNSFVGGGGPVGHYERYVYDPQGRQTHVIRPTDLSLTGPQVEIVTKTTFDAEDQIGSVTLADGSINSLFSFTYDEEGGRESVTYPSGAVKRWDRTFDADGNLTRLDETQVGAAAGPPVWKTSLYDPDSGRLTSLTDAAGNVIGYEYSAGLLEGKTFKLSGQATPEYNTQFEYDETGRVREVNTYAGGNQTTLLRGESREYDPETGRLSRLAAHEGTIDYGYDNYGSLSQISAYGHTVNYEYDIFGRLQRVTAPEGTWIYTYNSAGLKERVRNQVSGVVSLYEYDALGRLEKLTHRRSDGSILFEADYQLGIDGKRLGVIERRGTDVVTWEYRYDALGRLVREQRDTDGNLAVWERDVEYAYDADGNRQQLIDHVDASKTRTYAYYPNSQRLQSVTGPGYSATYTWTANGEMATRNINGEEDFFTWGFGGTLERVQLANDFVIEYDYDDTGTLIARRVFDDSGSPTPIENHRYLVDRENHTGYSQILVTLDANANVPVRFNTITDEIAGQTVMSGEGFEGQIQISDALKTHRLIARVRDESPATFVLDQYDYSPFGQRLASAIPLSGYGFTGQFLEPASGLQNHRSRWLMPRVGVWLSSDSQFDFPFASGNAYAYVGSSPLDATDPSGEISSVENLTVGRIAAQLTTRTFQILSIYSGSRALWDIVGDGGYKDISNYFVLFLSLIGGGGATFMWRQFTSHMARPFLAQLISHFPKRSVPTLASNFGTYIHNFIKAIGNSRFGRSLSATARMLGSEILFDQVLVDTNKSRPDFVIRVKRIIVIAADLKPVPDEEFNKGFLTAMLYPYKKYSQQRETHIRNISDRYMIQRSKIIYLYIPYNATTRLIYDLKGI